MFLNVFVEGGLLFTLPITILTLVTIYVFVQGYKTIENRQKCIAQIAALSTFALSLGVLGQVLGLMDGFKMIEQVEGISPQILAGGLRVSSISTLFGLIAFAIGRFLIVILRWK